MKKLNYSAITEKVRLLSYYSLTTLMIALPTPAAFRVFLQVYLPKGPTHLQIITLSFLEEPKTRPEAPVTIN